MSCVVSLFDKGLERNMAPHARKILEEHQKKGLELHSVVGVGGSSVVISATAKWEINPSVPAGKQVALKLSREGVSDIKNHSLAREGINIALLETRLARAEFGDIIPDPVFLWNSKYCRALWGYLNLNGVSMIFLCEELIGECFDDVMKPFGEKWRHDGVFDEAFQHTVLQPWFRLAFELRHTAALAVMDAKPANTGRRSNGRMALLDLGCSIVWPKPDESEKVVNALPVPLSRNATAAFDTATTKPKGSKLRGTEDKGSGLITVSNQQVSAFCRALTEQRRGMGRL
jgi:hypothetical protein